MCQRRVWMMFAAAPDVCVGVGKTKGVCVDCTQTKSFEYSTCILIVFVWRSIKLLTDIRQDSSDQPKAICPEHSQKLVEVKEFSTMTSQVKGDPGVGKGGLRVVGSWGPPRQRQHLHDSTRPSRFRRARPKKSTQTQEKSIWDQLFPDNVPQQ